MLSDSCQEVGPQNIVKDQRSRSANPYPIGISKMQELTVDMMKGLRIDTKVIEARVALKKLNVMVHFIRCL